MHFWPGHNNNSQKAVKRYFSVRWILTRVRISQPFMKDYFQPLLRLSAKHFGFLEDQWSVCCLCSSFTILKKSLEDGSFPE